MRSPSPTLSSIRRAARTAAARPRYGRAARPPARPTRRRAVPRRYWPARRARPPALRRPCRRGNRHGRSRGAHRRPATAPGSDALRRIRAVRARRSASRAAPARGSGCAASGRPRWPGGFPAPPVRPMPRPGSRCDGAPALPAQGSCSAGAARRADECVPPADDRHRRPSSRAVRGSASGISSGADSAAPARGRAAGGRRAAR